MKYMDVYDRFESLGLSVFSLDDLMKSFPGDRDTVKQQLSYWKKKGWVLNLKKGIYELAYPRRTVKSDLYIANRLYEPSYVSLETALSYYSIIPDVAMGAVTSVTAKTTRELSNQYGLFSYRSIVERGFLGYSLIHVRGLPVKIAEPEKAFADFLHYNKAASLDDMRFDRRKLKNLDKKKLFSYAGVIGASLEKTVRDIHADL
jgi:predicted transcriptional regulator of viral defense system